MVEVEITLPWEDTDTVRTREQMRVLGGEGAGHSINKVETDGPITDSEFQHDVRIPVKDGTYGDYDNAGRAATMQTARWFNVAAGGIGPGIPSGYQASLRVHASASHLHDFDPRDKLNELSLELRTAKVADLNALYGFDPPWLPGDIVLDWDFGDVDFPLFTYPIGEFANRLIEVRHSQTSNYRDRDGDDIGGNPGADSLAVWAIPVASPGASDPDGGEVQPDGDDIWECPELEGRGGEEALTTIYFVGDLLHVAPADAAAGVQAVTRSSVSNEWWAANVWTVVNPIDDYPTRGVPLAIGYEWVFEPEPIPFGESDTEVFNVDEAGDVTSTAEVWFESDWTPPRHRFRYFIEQAVVPPRRIFQRSDGATHGARRVLGGGNTVQAGNRAIGGIL